MLCAIQTGEYSDRSTHVTLEGPDDVDVKAAYAEALVNIPANTEHEWSDTKPGLIAQMVKSLETRGCVEKMVTTVHLGSYGRASLEIS
jgi:hypothetical protein